MIRAHVLICGGTGCTSSGSKKIQEAFEQNIAAAGLEEEVKLDTRELRVVLEGVPLDTYEVIVWIKEYLNEQYELL